MLEKGATESSLMRQNVYSFHKNKHLSTPWRILTVDIQFIKFLCRAGDTCDLTGVLSNIRHLNSGDLQELSTLHILRLSAGQNGLTVLVPCDGGEGHASYLTLQSRCITQQHRQLRWHVSSLNTGRHWAGIDGGKRKKRIFSSVKLWQNLLFG